MRAVLLLVLALVSCGPRESVPAEKQHGVTVYNDGITNIVRLHDDDARVTCWANYSHGIHCIPDHLLKETK